MNFIASEDDLKIKSELTVLYFYAPWLLLHKKVMSTIALVEKKFKNIPFYGIDINLYPGYIPIYNVDVLPKIHLLKDGKLIKSITGFFTEEDLNNCLEIKDDKKES